MTLACPAAILLQPGYFRAGARPQGPLQHPDIRAHPAALRAPGRGWRGGCGVCQLPRCHRRLLWGHCPGTRSRAGRGRLATPWGADGSHRQEGSGSSGCQPPPAPPAGNSGPPPWGRGAQPRGGEGPARLSGSPAGAPALDTGPRAGARPRPSSGGQQGPRPKDPPSARHGDCAIAGRPQQGPSVLGQLAHPAGPVCPWGGCGGAGTAGGSLGRAPWGLGGSVEPQNLGVAQQIEKQNP